MTTSPHRRERTGKAIGLLCAPLLMLAITGTARATAATVPSGRSLEALDYAFRFGSAIASDPKDRAAAQELALAEYTAAGAYDEVLKRADQIDGWRRGVVLANLAAAQGRAGRVEDARASIAKAQAVRAATTGWQGPRVSAHIAAALAVLGETESAGKIATDLATEDPMQYAGQSTATDAVAQAARGDFASAMARLKTLEPNDDLDVAWARTRGYVDLAGIEKAPRASRLEAVDAALASAKRLPLERRLDALLLVSSANVTLGRKSVARSAIAEAEKDIAAGAAQSEKIPALIAVGDAWARAGEPARAKQALKQAEALVPEALSIDQPGLWARVASAYRQIPGDTRQGVLDKRAFDEAAAMRLARPRALSLAAICRQMGKDGVAPDAALRTRLDALLAGLGDPW